MIVPKQRVRPGEPYPLGAIDDPAIRRLRLRQNGERDGSRRTEP